MMAITHANGFSTAVRIKLVVGDAVLKVASVGETSLILRDVHEFEPNTKASVIISVDGEEHVYPINLHEGVKDKFVTFEDLPKRETAAVATK
jgi:hypothetical protein